MATVLPAILYPNDEKSIFIVRWAFVLFHFYRMDSRMIKGYTQFLFRRLP
jgi:hypothetical protein